MKNLEMTMRSAMAQYGAKAFVKGPEIGTVLRWGDLPVVSERLLAYLSEKVETGVCVGVCMGNYPETVAAYAAILMSSYILVPIDPELKWPEIAELIERSNIQILLSTDANAEVLEKSPLLKEVPSFHCVYDQMVPLKIRAFKTQTNTVRSVRSRSAKLILFTSGSTGLSKGVILCGQSLMESAKKIYSTYRWNDGTREEQSDVGICVLPLFHMHAFMVCFLAPLLYGCTMVMPAEFDPIMFWKIAHTEGVTWMTAVPSVFLMLLKVPQTPLEKMHQIRFSRSFSAHLSTEVLLEFERRFGIYIVEGYGSTEAAHATSNPLPPAKRKVGSAGLPAACVVKIVDEGGSRLSHDQVGEILCSGANIFSGYLDDPAETARALKDGWYYTGDFGYLDQEGYLYVLGRKDDLISVAGVKVAPREIEKIIEECDGVEEVAVFGALHRMRGEQIIAAIKMKPEEPFRIELILKHCHLRMAAYKVPKYIVQFEAFPRKPTGKTDKVALREKVLKKIT